MTPNQEKKTPTKRSRFPMNWLFIALGAILLFNLFLPKTPPGAIPYSQFKTLIQQGVFQKVTLYDEYAIGDVKEGTRIPEEFKIQGSKVTTLLPRSDDSLIKLLDESGVVYEPKRQDNTFRDFILQWILPFAFIFFLWSLFFRRMGPGAEVMSFGKSRAKLQAEKDHKTTFEDVAGQDEAKEELKEVVDFLKMPKKFTSLGGKLPKGILLVGPPGTGKTLLARAVAGEAKVPFFNISGSDFVEMFVGVGAARVRDLFKQAKSKAPCIIFVDELDAIGKARGINPMGGHDEREQTLNQLLVEMDGFDSKVGVIIMAATNRPEILDPALLRAGRFDRQVVVGRPDLKERQEILELHAKNVKLQEGIDFNTIAQRTPGLVGADLANVINEAALLAARRDKNQVEMSDFEEAVDRILTGLQKKNRVINKKEKNIVAFHEAGHAIVAVLENSQDRVHKISIIPTGIGALGYTLQLPTEDRYLMTKNELVQKIDVLLGGRAAEMIIFEDVSTGAQDDLSRATSIARNMITQYGMGTTLGPSTIEQERTSLFMDRGQIGAGKNFSEETAKKVDEEVTTLMKSRLDYVVGLLKKNRALLDDVAHSLLTREVLSDQEFQAIVDKHAARVSTSHSESTAH